MDVYLVLWWYGQVPYAALFNNKVSAEAAAGVRNAVIVRIAAKGLVSMDAKDWWRRDDAGKPMPFEWRQLEGHITLPWVGKKGPIRTGVIHASEHGHVAP